MLGIDTEGNKVSAKNKGLVLCGLVVLSILMGGWSLSEKCFNNHEAYVAVVAREMLDSDDFAGWMIPTYNGKPRLQKTPLCYWLAAGTAKITGRVDEFSSRLPSVALAVVSVIAIVYFIERWLGFRTAALAAAVWSSSLGFCRYAHSSRPEMALAVFTTIAMLAFLSAMNEPMRKRQIWYMLVFWVSFALAMLAKGPAPIPLIGGAVLAYFLVFREWKKIGRTLPIIGTVIFLLIIF